MNYYAESTLQPINKGMYFLNGCQNSGNFNPEFTTMVHIELILHKRTKSGQYFELQTGLFSRGMLFVIFKNDDKQIKM